MEFTLKNVDLKDLIFMVAVVFGMLLWMVLRLLASIEAKLAVLAGEVLDRKYPVDDEDTIGA